jgi:hypothetical protein
VTPRIQENVPLTVTVHCQGQKKLPSEEVHRARAGRVAHAETSIPMELGCSTLPVGDGLINVKLPDTIIGDSWGGFTREVSLLKALVIGDGPQSPPLSTPWRMGWGWMVPAPNHSVGSSGNPLVSIS